MKVIFRLKSVEFFDKEDYISLARNIINAWDNMKDLDAMAIPEDIEVYVVDDDTKAEVVFDAEPVKHGRWMVDPGDRNTGYGGEIVCSECGTGGFSDFYDYCPSCGSKMDLEKENE